MLTKREIASLKGLGDTLKVAAPEPVAKPKTWGEDVRQHFYKPRKQTVNLRLDADVVAWLKRGGAGYQTRANQVLRDRMLKDIEGR